ncbi:MAG: class II aldolase/adducin family protein [Firmicutes bacterium]|nr:class II aldolase/adducin family protein [Bacillota bacterium]
MADIYELMKKYGALMSSQDYPVGESAKMILETPDGVYETSEGADMADLKEEDIRLIESGSLPVKADGIKAIVYSETPYSMQCLREGRSFRASLDDTAQIIGPEVKIARLGRSETIDRLTLMRALKSSVGCLVDTGIRRNGLPLGYTVTMGRTLYEAVIAMTVLEKAAEVTILADRIGGAKPLARLEARIMRDVYKKKYSVQEEAIRSREEGVSDAEAFSDAETEDNAAADTEVAIKEKSYPPREAELREALAEYGRRLVETGLVQGTWGNISVRLDDMHMLVTPSGLDYMRLGPDDMVRVEIATLNYEGSLKPTSEKGLHAEIYKRRPDVGAVIHTHSKYLSVFAAAEEDMPVLSEHMDVFGTKVKLAAYGIPGSKKLMTNTASALGSNFGVIMAHHGMAACGKDLETAFENCRKLEENGRAYLDSGRDAG